MNLMLPTKIPSCVSMLDKSRLEALIEHGFRGGTALNASASKVLRRLRTADQIVPPDDVPRDLVTMNSTVTLVDTISGTHWEITLVYPEEHDAVENCWSVLSPVGSAVFGLRLYAHADVRRNDLPDAEWVVAYISFQPETWGWMAT